ncbi:MAG TPA: TerC family protein [Candidatus Limnocylindrales bacterium]|nr:TerC family protein [Candidatus Limnocylindrales bacterium]
MESDRLVLWIVFNVFVLGMLTLDLGVFHRKAHSVSIKEAGIWSCVWVSLALIFNLGIYYLWGQERALEFLAGYVIEKSLSVDNLFVFLMIFQYFNTPAQYQHRILFWGIIGALILRAIFIATGSALLGNFHWTIYVFGGFLVITGIKMLLQGDEKIEPEHNPVVRLFERMMPVTHDYHGQNFFITKEGKTHATLMMLVLIVVETTDVIFAVDSIPAIFAVTQDPFIVYTSNVFAILGLRALYFMLAGIMAMFVYLKIGLSFVLCFVGAKMLLVDVYKIPIGASLAVIGGVLLLAVIASLIVARKQTATMAPATRRRNPARAIPGTPARIFEPTFKTVCLSFVFLGTVLTLVKWNSISRGPTGHEAIAVLRVVEGEVAQAKRRHRDTHAAILSRAESALEEAWTNLEKRRYQDAITTAQSAGQLIEKLLSRN